MSQIVMLYNLNLFNVIVNYISIKLGEILLSISLNTSNNHNCQDYRNMLKFPILVVLRTLVSLSSMAVQQKVKRGI